VRGIAEQIRKLRELCDKYEAENTELKKQLEDQNTKLGKLSYSTLNAIARDIESYDKNA